MPQELLILNLETNYQKQNINYMLNHKLSQYLKKMDIDSLNQLCTPNIWLLHIFQYHENHNLPILVKYQPKIYYLKLKIHLLKYEEKMVY